MPNGYLGIAPGADAGSKRDFGMTPWTLVRGSGLHQPDEMGTNRIDRVRGMLNDAMSSAAPDDNGPEISP